MTRTWSSPQVELGGGKKAIIIFVPYRLLRSYHKIQQRLVRELEKKFRYHLAVKSLRAIRTLPLAHAADSHLLYGTGP